MSKDCLGASFDDDPFPQVAWAVGPSGRHFSDEDLLSQA
jgi:hypothetical protein